MTQNAPGTVRATVPASSLTAVSSQARPKHLCRRSSPDRHRRDAAGCGRHSAVSSRSVDLSGSSCFQARSCSILREHREMDRSARAGASADTRALPVLRIGPVRVLGAAVLETVSLTSWVKSTGGRGLHVVVPIQPSLSWSDCLAFSRDVSEVVARTDPGLYTTAFSK